MLYKIAKTLLFSALPLFLLPLNAQAQIAADGTTSTTVTPTDAGVRIDNGDRSGSNLFHSFRDFSVQTGTEAHFNNANDVANIFSRVTGGNISDIDGLIRANGTANLFLINPNGIILGENASLNIGGSFFATTADGILFDDGVAFSASDPTTPLLTSSIPVGANFRGQPGDINSFTGGLTVSAGNTITLLGGNLEFNDGRIIAPGANIELGGLIAEGTVDLEENGSLTFPENTTRGDITFDNSVVNVQSSGGGNITLHGKNINLENNSELAVGIAATSTNPNPEAQAGNLEIDSVSNNPEEGITFDNSIIFNSVETNGEQGGLGNAGDIQITGNFLNLNNGSQIQSLVRNFSVDEDGNFVPDPNAAQGNAGNIVIDVNGAVTITGEGEKPSGVAPSSILSEVQTLEGNFNAGNITIDASFFSLGSEEPLANANRNRNQISSNAEGSSRAGNIDLNISDTVTITNGIIETNGFFGNIFIGAFLPNERNILESIEISNSTISATNSSVEGFALESLAGGITLNASDTITIANSTVTTDGFFGEILIGSPGLSNLEESENSIETVNSINILNNSQISATNTGPEAENSLTFTGRITLNASDTITIANSTVTTNGFFGAIFIGSPNLFDLEEAENSVEVETVNSINILDNSEISSTNPNPEGGAAGEITLNASDTIAIADNSRVETNGVFGQIFIGNSDFENVSLTPPSIVDINNSSIEATNESVVQGVENTVSSGNVEITADRDILLNNNSTINTFTVRRGDAGNVTLNAGNSITFQAGSQIRSETFAQGNPGTVRIGGIGDDRLPTVSFDGNIVVNEQRIESGIFTNADTEAGDRERSNLDNDGDVFIDARSLNLTDAAQIQTSTTGNLDAGDIQISIDESLRLRRSGIFASTETGSTGDGGNIQIGIFEKDENGNFVTDNNNRLILDPNRFISETSLSDEGLISASTSGTGSGGDIILNSNNLTLDNNSRIIAVAGFISFENESNVGGGNITINSPNSISMNGEEGRTFISAQTERNAPAGSITIETGELNLVNNAQIDSAAIIVEDDNSRIPSPGDGGNLTVTTQQVKVNNNSIITNQVQSGTGGNLTVIAETIEQDNGTISARSNEGVSGNIEVLTNFLTLNDESFISSETGSGTAGGITIENQNNTPLEILNLNNSNITVEAGEGSGGTAGNIEITTNFLEQNGGEIIANTESTGANINLAIQDFWFLRNESKVEADARGSENQQSTGGNININSNNENSDLIIIAFPAAEEGNDITANGFGANAGQIDVNANLLGTQVRNTEPGETGNNFLNDITARSDISSENNVEQSNVEDPSGSLVELPETVGDASNTIAQNPCEQGVGSEFLITGKGGFPANPQNNFSSNEVRVDLVQPVTPENQTATVGENNATSTEEPEVVPAQGWVFNNEGKVVLTAYDPTNEGVQRNQQSFTGCSVPQNQVQQNN